MTTSMLRRALESSDDGTPADEKTVVMKGPLADAYTDALAIAYAKDNASETPPASAADGGAAPDTLGTAANADAAEETTAIDPASTTEGSAMEDDSASVTAGGDLAPPAPTTPAGPAAAGVREAQSSPALAAPVDSTPATESASLKTNHTPVKKDKEDHDPVKVISKTKALSPAVEDADPASLRLPAGDGTQTTPLRTAVAEPLPLENPAVESQAQDAMLLNTLGKAVPGSAAADPSEDYMTIYAVGKGDVTPDDIVNVTQDLQKSECPEEYAIVIDATQPGPNGDGSSEPSERAVALSSALESIAEAYGAKVYPSLGALAIAKSKANK